MGGSVSAGVDNNDLVDNLLAADYIKTHSVERVFRAVDRGMYFTPAGRESAYKDLAWKSGNIHLSAPCIYCEVMENLNLRPGMSFLNLGSGTGYLSTMAGLILGSYGINHGVEIHRDVIEYAQEKLEEFKKNAEAIDESDFCEPKFVEGNCLQLDSCAIKYDRVYCGAACPPHFENYMKHLIKVGGILVVPLNDRLLRITRVAETVWEKRSALPVSFANLLETSGLPPVILPNAEPISLMDACRTTIRGILQAAVNREHPELKRRLPPKVKSKKQRTLRRLFIPMFGESESLTIITGLDHPSRRSRGDSDDNLAREEQSSGVQDQPSCEDTRGLSSSTSSDEPSFERNCSQHTRNAEDHSSDESDDPSDSSSSSSMTSSYKVQRALFRAMAHDIDSRNIPFTFTFLRSPQGNNTSQSALPDYDVASSESSSVPHDYSSDNSMDIDQPDSTDKEKLGSMKSKSKRCEGGSSKRARNKRKEAEMEESNYPCQSSGAGLRPQPARASSSTGDDEMPVSDEVPLATSSKKKNGAKREKVDSGIGDDIGNITIGNWDFSSSDVGSEVDFASDSDSEEDANGDDKIVVLNGHRRGPKGAWRGRDADPLAQEPKQRETNNYVIHMRSKIQELPLPPSLKLYINYFRDL